MERKSISFSAKISPIEKINDEFMKCKVLICALGKNRNFSYISREAAEDALYSLYNIPVIGHLYEGEDGQLHMGGHDIVLAKDEEGKYIYKALTVPYGVVPQVNDVHYEDMVEPNGDVKTYISAECILWTGRFPELLEAVYSDDFLFGQSMEINVEDYAPLEEDKNYTDILKYTYSALCLLGRSDDEKYHVEPCFPESSVTVDYALQDNKFAELMAELKKDLSSCFSNDEGKEEHLNMKDEIRDSILAEFNLTLEDIDFEIAEDVTEEDFRKQVEEFVQNHAQEAAEPEEPEAPEAEEEAPAPLAFTYRERLMAISEAMPNSERVYYYVCDADDKYAYVCREMYLGNGDYSEAHGRFEYSYDESEKKAAVVSDFEEMVVKWLTIDENKAIDAMRAAYAELVEYKATRETQDAHDAIDAALEAFSDLAGNEEFEAIVENKYSYESVKELEDACFIIRGKFGLYPKQHKPTEVAVPISAPKSETKTLRERFHEAYGKR